MRHYGIFLEISGPAAMWTRPDSGDAPVSYPVPTFSAAKGIFESIVWLKSAEVVPSKAEICSPVVYHTYTTNYGGPLRKSAQLSGGNNYQLIATILVNVCYRLYADVIADTPPMERWTPDAQRHLRRGVNGAHAYQEMFVRRLAKGQNHSVPCLGWSEFVADYVGPFRPDTQVCDSVNIALPSMLHRVFSGGKFGEVAPTFRQSVHIDAGVLRYAE